MAYIGVKPTIGNFQICDAISVVNGQAAYTMQVGSVNVIPQSANHMIVSLNGVIQKPGSSFTVSGSTITFASNLATGDVIDFIQILGDVLDLGTPSDATVSLAKLTATGTKDATTFLRGDNTFASAGSPSITDNGDANAITIESSERVQFTRARSNTLGDSALEIKPSDTVVGVGFRMENTNNDIVVEKSSPSGSEAEIFRIRSGGGIAIGGTGDANTLDDYEEGTWTPTFTHDGSAVSNVTINKANYTKVGRLVYVSMNARYTGSDLTGGNLIGAGLPFTSAAGNVLGVTGAYLHDPGSGSTNYDAGVAGSHDSNTNFFMIVTPGGRYQQRWLQNYYLSFACWYFV